jgi:hypothetical protein
MFGSQLGVWGWRGAEHAAIRQSEAKLNLFLLRWRFLVGEVLCATWKCRGDPRDREAFLVSAVIAVSDESARELENGHCGQMALRTEWNWRLTSVEKLDFTSGR